MLGFTYGEKLIEKFLYDGVVDMCYIAGGISLIRKQVNQERFQVELVHIFSITALLCEKCKLFGGRKSGTVCFWVVLMERSKRIFADASCEELDQQLSETVCFWASAFSTFRDYSAQ